MALSHLLCLIKDSHFLLCWPYNLQIKSTGHMMWMLKPRELFVLLVYKVNDSPFFLLFCHSGGAHIPHPFHCGSRINTQIIYCFLLKTTIQIFSEAVNCQIILQLSQTRIHFSALYFSQFLPFLLVSYWYYSSVYLPPANLANVFCEAQTE